MFDADAPPPAFCRLTAPFDAGALPATASVDAVSFHVAAAGERLCRNRGNRDAADAARLKAETALSKAPECAATISR